MLINGVEEEDWDAQGKKKRIPSIFNDESTESFMS
jgi:hypothetical protein